jgi:hypothetical protein
MVTGCASASTEDFMPPRPAKHSALVGLGIGAVGALLSSYELCRPAFTVQRDTYIGAKLYHAGDVARNGYNPSCVAGFSAGGLLVGAAGTLALSAWSYSKAIEGYRLSQQMPAIIALSTRLTEDEETLRALGALASTQGQEQRLTRSRIDSLTNAVSAVTKDLGRLGEHLALVDRRLEARLSAHDAALDRKLDSIAIGVRTVDGEIARVLEQTNALSSQQKEDLARLRREVAVLMRGSSNDPAESAAAIRRLPFHLSDYVSLGPSIGLTGPGVSASINLVRLTEDLLELILLPRP